MEIFDCKQNIPGGAVIFHFPDSFFIHIFLKLYCNEKNKYDVTALAVLYFPESTKENARRRFFKVLLAEKDLWRQLTDLHFGKWQRTLTPRQYEMIVDRLGVPEPDADDFSDWDC